MPIFPFYSALQPVLLAEKITGIVPSSTMAQIILFALAPDLFVGQPSESLVLF